MRAIPLPDGDLRYAPDFLAPAEADQFMRQLLDGIEWQQHHVVIFGRQHPAPRLSAWHGSPEAHYAYSGLALEPRPWTEPLLDLKTRLEAAADCPFNSVLLNQYRDGRDSMGWHSDDEPELGTKSDDCLAEFGRVAALPPAAQAPRPSPGRNPPRPRRAAHHARSNPNPLAAPSPQDPPVVHPAPQPHLPQHRRYWTTSHRCALIPCSCTAASDSTHCLHHSS